MFKRIAIGAVSLALPLAALAGAPAYATDKDHGGHDSEPTIEITDLNYKHGKFVVDVDYECAPEHSRARVWVKLKLNHAYFEGYEKVHCDDDEASIYLYGHGKLKSGHAHVDAYIKEKDGDTDHDYAKYEVRVKRGHGGHH
ncbi:MAG TPA: hypothetical protein VEQ66_03085 [Propionibacteriaceae bacterium]|nr:hypothetical protein [Propionibacteriaceae bacterium]